MVAPTLRTPAPLPEALAGLAGVSLLPGVPSDIDEVVLLAGAEGLACLAALRPHHRGLVVAMAAVEDWPAWWSAGADRLLPLDTPTAVLAPMLVRLAREAQAAAHTEALLTTLLERSGLGLVVVDDEGEVLRHNEQARAVLSMAPAEASGAVGRSTADYEVFAGGAHPLFHAATTGVEVGETRFELVRGGAVRMSAVPLHTGARRLGAVALIRAVGAAADQTLATGVHALKNPLSVMQGFAEALLEELPQRTAEVDHLLRRIQVNSSRLWWRVDDLHRYLRLADVRFEREICPLSDVLDAARLKVLRRGRVGEMVLAEDLPSVMGDFARLVELFEVLLDNALCYQPPGNAAWVRVTGERLGTLCRIHVEDNGLGIAPEDRQRIFEPFARLHRHDEYEGTGLGLAIAERIVARHDGHVEVHEAPEGGALFMVTLPAVSVTASKKP